MWGEETLMKAFELGLIDFTHRLTPAGESVAQAEDRRILAAKQASRVRRAARKSAYE